VDGDRTTDSRTTGDVAFDLAATAVENTIYLIYDSVLTIDTNRTVTSGEVRLAVRESADFTDWRYRTLDGPEIGNTVAGYAVSISANNGSVVAGWLVAKANVIPNPSLLSYAEVTDEGAVFSIEPTNVGVLGSPLSVNADTAAFSCGKRLCLASQDISTVTLINAESPVHDVSNILSSKKKRFVFAAVEKDLISLRF
jgi:hypothetical protein